MKNIFYYYLAITVPFGIIMWLIKTKPFDSAAILGLFIFYLVFYRTYIDGKRLVEKNIIEKKDIWKMIIPGKRFEYFKELYWK